MPKALTFAVQLALALGLIWAAAEGWQQRERIAALLGTPDTPAPGPSTARPSGVPVVVSRAGEAADDVRIGAVGTGRARRSVTLKPKVSGEVVAMEMAAGRFFAEDAVLMRLDDRDQRLALDLAEARLAEARRVLDRYEELQSRSITSQATFTEARTAFEIARIERDQAAAALDDRTLRAPFAGVSSLPEVEIGDRVDEDTEIASFDDRAEILVEFNLPEAWLARLAGDAAVTATTASREGERFEGRVAAIDSRVDPVSRTARVRVVLPNAGDRLRPGASFTVDVVLPGPDYPTVPELALQFAREGPFVWRVTGDDRAEQVPVRLVRRFSGTVLVEGALEPGDAVVVEGVQRLREGRPVEVIDTTDTVVAERG